MVDYVKMPAPKQDNPNKNIVANVVSGVIIGMGFIITVLSSFFY